MTSKAAFSALGPVGSVADNSLFTTVHAEKMRTTVAGRERGWGGWVTAEGTLYRHVPQSSYQVWSYVELLQPWEQTSRHQGCRGTCVCASMCQWLSVWEAACILAASNSNQGGDFLKAWSRPRNTIYLKTFDNKLNICIWRPLPHRW